MRRKEHLGLAIKKLQSDNFIQEYSLKTTLQMFNDSSRLFALKKVYQKIIPYLILLDLGSYDKFKNAQRKT